MSLPDQGTPAGHHDVANTNDTLDNPPALPRAASYGSDGIPGYMYEDYSIPAPAPASPMPVQPVYSPMAGYAMQQNAAWVPTPQDMQTGQLCNPNMRHHLHSQQLLASRAVGPAPANWLAFAQSQPHYPPPLPAGPLYTTSSGFGPHAPTVVVTPRTADHAFAQEPVFQADTQLMQLENSSGALQHSYGFLAPEQFEQFEQHEQHEHNEQQMMSMAAAMNAQHQQMHSMMPHQTIDSSQLPVAAAAAAAAPSWPTAQGQAFYYSQFGYSPVHDPAMGYDYMQAMPNVPNTPYPGAVPQPMYLSPMMGSTSITSFQHPQMMHQQLQQQQQLTPPQYPGPSISLSHSMEDDTRNDTRRKFVRTDSGTGGGALSNRRSSVNVHGYSHAAPMPELAPDSVSSQTADGFLEPVEPEPQGESNAGEDSANDLVCKSPVQKRNLSVSSEEWNDEVLVHVHPSLATVPENSRLEPGTRNAPPETADKEKRPGPPNKKDNTPTAPAPTAPTAPAPTAPTAPAPTAPALAAPPQMSTGKQEAVFVHMDAAEILQSSHSIFSDEHDSGSGPVKPAKFRPAGNAPIKVRKWSTVVHPPPPESGNGSMPRVVDFDHSASNVFLQHQAQPVAPSSVTSRFKSATPSSSSAKSNAKQDGTGSASSPSPNQVRTLNWRPSDDRIFTASAALPPKTTTKAARLEEKKKATPNDETKAVNITDAAPPDAESENPISVRKALAALSGLSGKRGKAAQTARVARTKQVRKRTDGIASKPAMDLKATGTPKGSTADPKEATLLAETKTDSITTT